MKNNLKDIGNSIRTQDNRCTSDPLFIVYQKRRIYGIDTSLTDDIVWRDNVEGYEANEDEVQYLEKIYDESFGEPDGWDRTGYVDIDVFVTACFTEEGAKNYIEVNGHRLKNPYIFVDTLYRNKEMILVRESIKRLPTIQQFAGDDVRETVDFIENQFKLNNPEKDNNWMNGFHWGAYEAIKYFETAIDLEKAELIKTSEDSIKRGESTRDFYKRRTERLNEWFRSDELKDTKMAYEWFAINANGHLMTDYTNNEKL